MKINIQQTPVALPTTKLEIAAAKAALKLNFTPAPAVQLTDNSRFLHGTGILSRDLKRAQAQADKLSEQTHDISKSVDLFTTAVAQLPAVQLVSDLEYDPSQRRAIDGIMRNQFSVLIGPAGSGKSTIIRAIYERLIRESKNPNFAFMCPTGRAVESQKRALPRDAHELCDTMHGWLQYAPEVFSKDNFDGTMKTFRKFVPRRTEFNQLEQNIVILDEAGNCQIDVWENLVRAMQPNTRVILVGDINQLPPVQGRSVLGFAMQKWPVFELDTNHRAQHSPLIAASNAILEGNMKALFEAQVEGVFKMHAVDDGSLTAFQQTIAIIQYITREGKFDPLLDSIITPQNRDTLGQEHFNSRLCASFNPLRTEHGHHLNPRISINAGIRHVSLAIGDKVMVTKNSREAGLTNGMIGVVESIQANERFRGISSGDSAGSAEMISPDNFSLDGFDESFNEFKQTVQEKQAEDDDEATERQASHIVKIRFQNRLDEPHEFATAGGVNSLYHAYASTVHKLQGGEVPFALVLIHGANAKMLSRELFYTAVTRAREKCIVLYSHMGIQKAMNYQHIKGQTIEEKAVQFNKLQQRNAMGDSTVRVPTLYTPRSA